MGAFLIRQMDYSLFCNGLSLFLTALTATVFARRTRSKTSMPPDFPWPCLALFGVLHGLENWMELLALSLGDRSFLQALSPGLHLAGLFSLFEFGRRGLSCGGLRPLGKGLWPILLCMEGIFALLGPRELLVGTGYLLGLLGGLFVGGALFLHQGKIRFGRSSFFLFLSALTLHAALGALLAGKAPFFPLNLLRDDGLNHPFPIGLLTVSALLALIMSVSLSLYLNESRRGDLPAWQGVARLRYRIAGILIFPALLLLGWIGVELSGNREEASMERQLLRQVKSVAAAVDPEEVKRLSGGPEDLKRPEYGHVRRILRNVRLTTSDIRFVYLMAMKGDEVVILMDSEPPESKDHSPPGESYNEASEALRSVFHSLTPIVEGPVPDQWGVWVSGIAPVLEDRSSTKALAVLGLDISAHNWNRRIAEIRFLAIVITLFAVVLLLGALIVSQVSQEMLLRIASSERLYREIFESRHAVNLVLERRGGTIVEANTEASAFYGYPKETLLGMRLADLDTRPEAATLLDLREAGHEAMHVTRAHRLKSGDTRFVDIYWSPVTIGDTPYLFCTLHDITERRRMEEELLRAKEAAESADRAKGVFLTTVGHEVRTPLNGILGFSDLLLETDLTLEQREFIQAVKEGGKALLDLMDDILDFSRIESGSFLIEKAPFAIGECVSGVLKGIVPLVEAKGLRLAVTLDPLLPPIVLGDRKAIGKVLYHLLTNAAKFTAMGEVRLSVEAGGEEEEIEAQGLGEGHLVFRVQDTGIGIPQGAAKALFDPFHQVDSSRTRTHGGVGLGLAICSRLVGLMGGVIEVESTHGEGSLFTVTLPYERDDPSRYLRAEAHS